MGIFGKNKYNVNFLSLPQQVSKNKIDIENLQKIIKQAYKTTTQLTEQSVSVALNATNITDTTIKSGWIMDPNGLLFQIASVLEDLVYINFWANLKGPQGEQGPQGPQGIQGPLPSVFDLSDMILGSESVVVDITEDNKALEIHLDGDTLADINKSLKTPVVPPATTKLVAVDETNSQEMLTLGAGLTIENGTLNASAGGSKLYQHIIQFIEGNIILITKSKEIFTTDTLKQYFISLGIGDDFSNRYRIKNIIDITASSAKISIYNSIYVDGTRLCFRGTEFIPTITEGVLTYTVIAISPSVYVQGDTVIEL